MISSFSENIPKIAKDIAIRWSLCESTLFAIGFSIPSMYISFSWREILQPNLLNSSKIACARLLSLWVKRFVPIKTLFPCVKEAKTAKAGNKSGQCVKSALKACRLLPSIEIPDSFVFILQLAFSKALNIALSACKLSKFRFFTETLRPKAEATSQ